jgi:hypothetical protein
MKSNKIKLLFALAAILSLFNVLACSSKPKREALKAERLSPELKNSETIDGKSKIGVDQDENVMVSEQTAVAEYMHNLENEVRMQNDEIYGSAQFGSQGLAGKLKDCYRKKHKAGVTTDDESIPQLSAEMQEELQETQKVFKKTKDVGSSTEVGYNEKGQLIRSKTEDLHLRIERFQKIKAQQQANRIQIQDKLADCSAKE